MLRLLATFPRAALLSSPPDRKSNWTLEKVTLSHSKSKIKSRFLPFFIAARLPYVIVYWLSNPPRFKGGEAAFSLLYGSMLIPSTPNAE